MNKPELLAPAGNLEKLKTALAFGADAVYCGLPDFSLRVRINDFDMPKLKQGIEYAHALGKKVYVTVNIFAHQRHLKKLPGYVKSLKKISPDALIVSDPGILQIIKKYWPTAEIHLSTQANCTNGAAAKFWSDNGVTRIILGREVTLAEIQEIHRAAPKVELEYFCHGAMCMAYSGRCLLSKFFTDKSANLGDCTQPCRWQYRINTNDQFSNDQKVIRAFITEEKRPNMLLEMEEDTHGSYIMNSQDLCLIEYLPAMAKAGVVSFKIEGRAKSVYYVGAVTRAYREAIDSLTKKDYAARAKVWLKELAKCQNRGFTSGFLFGKEKCHQLIDQSHAAVAWEYCGEVIVGKKTPKGFIAVKVHNQIKINDQVELLAPNQKTMAMTVKKMYNKDRELIEEVHGGQGLIIFLPTNAVIPAFTLLRRKVGG